MREILLKALDDPTLLTRMLDTGFEAGLPRSQDEVAQSLKADYDRIGAMLKSIGFKPERGSSLTTPWRRRRRVSRRAAAP